MILSRKDFDSCDRCGTSASATVRVVTGNGPVDLCGHHFRQYELVIMAAGFQVVQVVIAA